MPPAALRLLLTVEIAPLLRQSDAAAHGGAPLLRWRTSLGRRVATQRHRAPAPPPRAATERSRILRGARPPAPPPLATADGGRVRLPTDRGLPSQRLRRAAADDGAGAAEAEAGAVYNRRALRELPAALLGAGDWEELASTLASHRWIHAKLRALGLHELLGDYELPPPPAEHEAAAAQLAALGATLALCADILVASPDQLEAQLLCRLPHWARDASALAGGADLLDTLMLQSELHLARVARAAAAARERAFALAAEGKEAVTAPPPPQPLFPRWPCLPASPPLLFALLQPSAPPVALDAAADGSVVACACADGSARVFDLATGGADALVVAPPAEAGRFHEQAALGVALSPDASFLVVHTAAWHVSIYALPSAATPSLLSATRLTDLAPGGDGAPSLPPLAPLPLVVGDGLLLCSGGAGGAQLRVWELPPTAAALAASFRDPKLVCSLAAHRGAIRAIALAADGARAATAGADGLLVLWARRQGSGAWVKEAEADADDVAAVNSVALLHAGRPLAATGGDDSVVRVWHIEAGKGGDGGGGFVSCALTLRGHTAAVRSVRPVWHRLASASDDGTVRLWDVLSGAPVSRLPLHAALAAAGLETPPGAPRPPRARCACSPPARTRASARCAARPTACSPSRSPPPPSATATAATSSAAAPSSTVRACSA